MKTRTLPLLTFLIVLAHLTGSAIAVEHNSRFTDVSPDSWYADPVTWAVAQGITTGTSSTTFSPDDICTNAQVITFIWRACGEPEPIIDNPFNDVSEDEYYYKAALWAYANEMVIDSSFQANTLCTRSMAMTYLWREAGNPGVPLTSVFSDVNANTDLAQSVAWAVEAGITDGTSDSTFSPETTCTRAHIITFLYRDLAESTTTDRDLKLEIVANPESDSDYLEITA